MGLVESQHGAVRCPEATLETGTFSVGGGFLLLGFSLVLVLVVLFW